MGELDGGTRPQLGLVRLAEFQQDFREFVQVDRRGSLRARISRLSQLAGYLGAFPSYLGGFLKAADGFQRPGIHVQDMKE